MAIEAQPVAAVARAAIVIPARYRSQRFPGKPLAPLRGVSGQEKPLIERSFEAASRVASAASVHIATDDARIADAGRDFGASVIMTPEHCLNGTERIAAALDQLPADADVIVNLQGDAPLTPPHLVEALIAHMRDHPDCPIATVAVRCSPAAYRRLLADQAAGLTGGTTVVLNAHGEALYFSKRVLPYIAPHDVAGQAPPVLLHLGLYAYRRDALRQYAAAPACALEQLEGLEQLRFLYLGVPITVITSEPPEWDVIELNNPSDIEPIEAILSARNIA